MKKYQLTARVVGVGMLLLIALSIFVNMIYLGPIVFAPDFLTNVSANANQVKISILLELLNGTLSVGIAVLLLPIFIQHNKSMAYGYFGFSIFTFTIIAVDIFSILSILSLSKEYVSAGSPDTAYFQTLGTLLYENRWWSHYMTILVSCLPLFIFYLFLYQIKLIPRFISIWGIAAVPLIVAAVLLAIFDQDTYMGLMMPGGINQIFLGGWLIVKGFNSSAIAPTSVTTV